jgi:hypothetical protein
MFIETSKLKTLTPGENVNISGVLEVIAKKAGISNLASDVHATLNLNQIFGPDMDGKDASVKLTVKT